MKTHLLSLIAALGLSACMSAGPTDAPSRAAQPGMAALPPMKVFADQPLERVQASNADIARDFLDLSFRLESGRQLAVLSRFEGPITVRVAGEAPAQMRHDLARLLARLRAEAGIDIRLTNGNSASITVAAVKRRDIQRHFPEAACFVAPNVSSLADYARAINAPQTDWTLLRERKTLVLFIPTDTAPQETRDCLHEEMAQALGPLNDLYRLPDSVFNDDNVHTVLTRYDMLILRAYYAPELQSGMTQAQVAQRLPAILARLNPAGQGKRRLSLPDTPRAWVEAIQQAQGPDTSPENRQKSAVRALAIAENAGWTDHRRAYSHYVLARLTQRVNAQVSVSHFRAAMALYSRDPSTQLHAAHVADMLAAYAITEGNAEEALLLTGPYLAVAARHENAALLSTLQLLRAEALDLQGRSSEAQAVRLDSLGWARYGFGPDRVVYAKLHEIRALSPKNRGNGQS